MPLLQLPREIFECITSFVVSSQELKDIFQYREVCKTFNNYICAEICERASHMTIDQLFASAELKKTFRTHGALILTKRVMRGNHGDNVVLKFVQKCVSFALLQGLGAGEDQETRRLHCTSVVCNLLLIRSRYSLEEYLKDTDDVCKAVEVFSMHEIIPAIAAALDNSELLFKYAPSSWRMVTPSCKVLPCALNAAVAFGSIQTLSRILELIEKGTHDDGFPRIGLEIALKLAIRLHQSKAGAMVFDLIKKLWGSFRLNQQIIDSLIKDCVRHGDLSLMLGALRHQSNQPLRRADINKAKSWTLSSKQYYDLFRYGGTQLLKFFLDHKVMDPDTPPAGCCYSSSTPLMLNLEKRRFDLARVLLDNGADINGTKESRPGPTPLVYAADKGYYEAVRFLLCNGANTALTDHDGKDVLWFAKWHGWDKCEWSIKKATTKGVDSIRHVRI